MLALVVRIPAVEELVDQLFGNALLFNVEYSQDIVLGERGQRTVQGKGVRGCMVIRLPLKQSIYRKIVKQV